MSDKMREAFEEWAKSECLDTDSVDGFYSDDDTHIAWGSWQAAQSAAVPVVGDVGKMAESISGMVMEWVTAASAHNGDWQSGLARIIRKRIERFQPTTSITAAELERLQRKAATLDLLQTHHEALMCERFGRELGIAWISQDGTGTWACTEEITALADAAIAAIAGEKK